MLLKDWIQKDCVSVTPDTNLLTCKSLFKEHGVNRIPVVDANNKVIGLISNNDIKEFQPQHTTGLEILEMIDILEETPTSQIMFHNPVTININTTVEIAALTMDDHKIGFLPVVDDAGKLLGTITGVDIFKAFIRITGVRDRGVQISFLLENKPGTLRAKLDILKEYGARVISVLSVITNEGKRNVTLRFLSTQPDKEEQLISDLSNDESVVYWGKDGILRYFSDKA